MSTGQIEWLSRARGAAATAMPGGHLASVALSEPMRLDKASRRDEHRRRFFERHALVVASTAQIGSYRVLEPLGEGGMGVVYRARHSRTDRVVAIKTVRVSGTRWVESIRREIDALTRFRHPGIVRIIEHGMHEGRPWYAMELLEGESLRDFGARIWSPFRLARARRGPVVVLTATEPVALAMGDAPPSSASPTSTMRASGRPPVAGGALPQVLALIRRVCATLAFLHGEGFVSCDMKPENVLLVGATPVLIDFGLSRRFPAATGRETIDTQRTMAGTVPYMSPEQLTGELVDARSDLYSLGCILYELLTGAPPFIGAPFAVRAQHLTATPVPPSQVVRDVPHELESLVLRLLSKEPNGRVGFADEIADALGRLAGDTPRLHEYPPCRPYLYRPRFVGRRDALELLSGLRDAALRGRGALALVGGESGAGKTRLLLELSRPRPGSGLAVIASESVSLAPDQSALPVSAPLHAVRPFLRAVADHCLEAGPAATDRLLGARRAVLAAYEPLLAEVPALEPLAPLVPLDPEASRQRVLRYLAQTLTAFAQHQPLLWLLDDLAWADDLSLSFLESLTESYFAETPALVIGAYRSEEASDEVRTLVGRPHVVDLTLPRLCPEEVATMVADMLAAQVPDAQFAAYIAEAAEGNPFFVTEHLRTAVGERVFYRDASHIWRMRSDSAQSTAFGALPIPRSLRDLIENRLRALTHEAQLAVRAAAVLGREADSQLIAEVADLSAEAATAAFGELIRRHVFEPATPERLRFAHDKLREVAYSTPVEASRALHARAAAALERASVEYTEGAADSWSTLGHHFASAGLPEPAARYLEQAADHARARFANVDAITLYRRAIEQTQAVLAESTAQPVGEASRADAAHASLLRLQESLADVLALCGQRADARDAYGVALRALAPDEGAALARLRRKIGYTWEAQGQHSTALDHYRQARLVLPTLPAADMRHLLDEWMSVRFDELRVNYWLARPADMEVLMQELGAIVESHGSPAQRAGFCQGQVFHRLSRDRYEVCRETLVLSATVLETFGADGTPDRAWAYFQHGFTRLLAQDIDAAEADLARALELSERAGDVVNQARAALYLVVAARMRNQPAEVEVRLQRASRVADEAGMPQYIAAAKATRGWLELRRGNPHYALALADEALAGWSGYGGVFPFHWLARVPQLAASVALGDLGEAIESCRAMLETTQRRLPARVEATMLRAAQSWEEGDGSSTRAHLQEAIEALASHSYS